jgi:hypothetical protein
MDAALTVGDFFFGGNWASLTVANLYHRGTEEHGGNEDSLRDPPARMMWSFQRFDSLSAEC